MLADFHSAVLTDPSAQLAIEVLYAQLRAEFARVLTPAGILQPAILPANVIPIGGVILWARAIADGVLPDGYLVCDGRVVNRRLYADLFNVIGTTFGAGDGVSTFQLPTVSTGSCTGLIYHG